MSTVPSQLRSLLRVIRSCPYSRSMLVGPIMATILGLGVMPHLRGPTWEVGVSRCEVVKEVGSTVETQRWGGRGAEQGEEEEGDRVR